MSFTYLAAASLGRYTAVFSAAGGTTFDTPQSLLLNGAGAGLAPGGVQVTTPADLRLLFPLGRVPEPVGPQSQFDCRTPFRHRPDDLL